MAEDLNSYVCLDNHGTLLNDRNSGHRHDVRSQYCSSNLHYFLIFEAQDRAIEDVIAQYVGKNAYGRPFITVVASVVSSTVIQWCTLWLTSCDFMCDHLIESWVASAFIYLRYMIYELSISS